MMGYISEPEDLWQDLRERNAELDRACAEIERLSALVQSQEMALRARSIEISDLHEEIRDLKLRVEEASWAAMGEGL